MNFSYFTFVDKKLAVKEYFGSIYPAIKVLKLNETPVAHSSVTEILEQLATYIEEGVPRLVIEGEGEVDSTFYGNDDAVLFRPYLSTDIPGGKHGVKVINDALTYLRDRNFDEAWNNLEVNPFKWTLTGFIYRKEGKIYTFYQDAQSFTARGAYDASGKTVSGDNIFNFLGLSDSSLYNKDEWPNMAVYNTEFSMGHVDDGFPPMTAEMIRAYATLCAAMGF